MPQVRKTSKWQDSEILAWCTYIEKRYNRDTDIVTATTPFLNTTFKLKGTHTHTQAHTYNASIGSSFQCAALQCWGRMLYPERQIMSYSLCRGQNLGASTVPGNTHIHRHTLTITQEKPANFPTLRSTLAPPRCTHTNQTVSPLCHPPLFPSTQPWGASRRIPTRL